jgi:propanediol dehydratase large subunit
VEVLERPAMSTMDPDVFVLDSLTDKEFDLIQELREICKAGYDEERAREMMGSESYDSAIAVIQKVEEESEKLTMHPLRKLAAPVKYRKHMGDGLGCRNVPAWGFGHEEE